MGKLIVFEGTDGSGKSTQFSLLTRRLEARGVDFRTMVFPQYTEPSSALIRMYLGGEFGARPSDVNAYTASTFYAVDRFAAFRKVISWQIPVAYIGTVAVLTFLFPQGNDAMSWMLYNVLGGGLFLGAFFMATDYVTSPVTKKGQLIFGIGCGLITVFIRYFGSYPEGVCYSILVMNCCTWIIDKYTKPTRFGVDKKAAKEAAKK